MVCAVKGEHADTYKSLRINGLRATVRWLFMKN